MAEKTTRRERERQRHRREVLEAARELFARDGYERTTMARIAERAEFAVGTLYKFFEDKAALYRALILDTVDQFADALCEALDAPGSEPERIARYIDTKARLFVQHIPTARLYFAQTGGPKTIPAAAFDEECRTRYQRVLDRVERLFRSGIEKGLFLNIDPALLTLAVEGVCNGFLNVLIEHPEQFTPESLAALCKTIFFERIRLDGARRDEGR